MEIRVALGAHSYDIILQRGCLSQAGKLLQLERRVLLVTDDGVPQAYADTVAKQCLAPEIVTIPQGEASKSLASFERLLTHMLQSGFTRKDCVVAVGGGVVGDLAGFAAASFMRGIDFYNIPTTVLSQVDSSIGGKTAVNLNGVKNIVGAFYQPKRVLIDPDVLDTLPARQRVNGLAESVKMALTSDPALFEIFEAQDPDEALENIIYRSLLIKKGVVEQDEREAGLRRVLNYGHTIGHGLESPAAGTGLYHGESVALGMLPFCSDDVRLRLLQVLKKLGLPINADFDADAAMEAILHDKKGASDGVDVVFVPEVGSYTFRFLSFPAIREAMETLRRRTS